ncbi:MAG: amidohydrolase [Halieaceae bacterium]|nr:amidohydrolase [Halieaceae bacterium]
MKSLLRAVALLGTLGCAQASAEDATSRMVDSAIGSAADNYSAIARDIWEFAEVGYQEEKSSARLQGALRAAGFEIETGVAGIPTSFIASYGKGEPVIGVLAEFDALPGVSQMDVPERMPVPGGTAGHACGHHLFGTGSVAAAITVKEWLEETGSKGTIRLYGTPAEEGGSGKVYMVRAGLFDDVDTVIHWHASDRNSALPGTTLANRSAKFRFHGKASHAAAAPERGRSALDGVEAMNMMVNMMREHVPSSTRIHHVITRGGNAPNVVPEFAEVFYYVRAPSPDDIRPIWAWVENAAEGAAMGTQTRVEWEIIHGNYNILPNVTLARVMHDSLETFGGIEYDRDEQRFAEALVETYNGKPPRGLGSQEMIASWTEEIQRSSGSSDVGDVSWMAPTVGLNTATWVPGTAAHSWQAVAAGGTSIGSKGMLLAARSMALTAIRLFEDPELVASAQQEWLEMRGGKRIDYEPLLGDRDPPLDYRK